MFFNCEVFAILIAILTLTDSLIGHELCCKSSDQNDKICSAYTYRIIKPMLEYFAKINNEIEIKNKKINELEQIVEIKSITLKNNELHLTKLHDKSVICETELQNLTAQSANLRDSLNIKEAEVFQALSNLTLCEKNCNEIEIKNKKIAELEQIVETNTITLINNKQQLAKLNDKSEICETELQNLTMQNSNLKDSVNIKEAEVFQTQSNLTLCEKNVSDKDVELNSLKEKLVEYKQKLEHLPKSCVDLKNFSGILALKVEGLEPFDGSCDSNLAGSGWTVIQRRIDGKVNFYRPWEDYKNGFGNVNEEFWFGLERLHRITSAQRYELYIQLVDQENETRFARYDDFRIGSEQEKYKLISIGEFSGNAGDSMKLHKGRNFSTYDSDNDDYKSGNCASTEKGSWWYFYCADSNLNGKRFDCNVEDTNELETTGCIYWQNWHGRSHSIKNVQMMIRPFESI